MIEVIERKSEIEKRIKIRTKTRIRIRRNM